jgi:hypothetical protein
MFAGAGIVFVFHGSCSLMRQGLEAVRLKFGQAEP